jgi:hypothetical protein
MKSIHLKSRIKANGILELRVPTGLPESDVELVIVVQPIPSALQKESPEERGWLPEFFERTAGSLADDPIKRWPQDPRDDVRPSPPQESR